MASGVPPRATYPELMKVLFICQDKNLSWFKQSTNPTLLKTVLQRQTCKRINDMAVGIVDLPVSLYHIYPSSPVMFVLPEPAPEAEGAPAQPTLPPVPVPRKRLSTELAKPVPAPGLRCNIPKV